MTRAFVSQVRKLRRPGMLLGAFGASAAFAVLATAVTVGAAGDEAVDAAPGSGPARPSLADLAAADGAVLGLESAASFLGIVAFVVCAAAVAQDHAWGTLRGLLVRLPERVRLLGGTSAALFALVAAAALLAAGAAVLTAFLAAGARGLDTSAWTSAEGLGQTAGATGAAVLAMTAHGLLGVALGSLLRSPVAAIGVGVAWLLPVETVLAGTIDGADEVLPGRLLAAVAEGGTADIAFGAALALAEGWVVAALALAAWRFATQDVTA